MDGVASSDREGGGAYGRDGEVICLAVQCDGEGIADFQSFRPGEEKGRAADGDHAGGGDKRGQLGQLGAAGLRRGGADLAGGGRGEGGFGSGVFAIIFGDERIRHGRRRHDKFDALGQDKSRVGQDFFPGLWGGDVGVCLRGESGNRRRKGGQAQ